MLFCDTSLLFSLFLFFCLLCPYCGLCSAFPSCFIYTIRSSCGLVHHIFFLFSPPPFLLSLFSHFYVFGFFFFLICFQCLLYCFWQTDCCCSLQFLSLRVSVFTSLALLTSFIVFCFCLSCCFPLVCVSLCHLLCNALYLCFIHVLYCFYILQCHLFLSSVYLSHLFSCNSQTFALYQKKRINKYMCF